MDNNLQVVYLKYIKKFQAELGNTHSVINNTSNENKNI